MLPRNQHLSTRVIVVEFKRIEKVKDQKKYGNKRIEKVKDHGNSIFFIRSVLFTYKVRISVTLGKGLALRAGSVA